MEVNKKIKLLIWIKPREKESHKTLNNFIEIKFDKYADTRNDPNSNILSRLSPYLHFGQISSQRVALIFSGFANHPSAEAFLEELIFFTAGLGASRNLTAAWAAANRAIGTR